MFIVLYPKCCFLDDILGASGGVEEARARVRCSWDLSSKSYLLFDSSRGKFIELVFIEFATYATGIWAVKADAENLHSLWK